MGDLDAPKPHQEFPESYYETKYKWIGGDKPDEKKEKPKSDDKKDKEHEQYVLRANRDGEYPIMQWGQKDPVGKVKLKRGDVWKYGTTVNPDSRYSQVWLRKMHLRKSPQTTGSASYVLAQEGIRIVKYFIEHGKLPPGNKMFK